MMSVGAWRPCYRKLSSVQMPILRGWYGTSTQQATSTAVSDGQLPKYTAPGTDEIIIPQRIKRDELAMLKALAATVRQDTNGPAYKYIDDPATIPYSNVSRRVFGLAKASGKKAAQYVIKRYPGNFMHNPAEPSIEAFMPPTGPVLPDDTEEGLQERIELRLIEKAYTCYQNLSSAGVKVADNTVQDLLDLLCAFNSEDPPDMMLPDERFFQAFVSSADASHNSRKTWNDSGYAEILFKSLEKPSAAAYAALLRGRAKFCHVEGAYDIYCKMKDNNMIPDVRTFNAVLNLALVLKFNVVTRVEFLKDIMKDMARLGVQPTIDTFNAVLCQMSRRCRGNQALANQFIMATLNEMKSLGIEPDLASWVYVVSAFYATDESNSNILYEIMDEVEKKELAVTHPTHMEFFSIAMAKCCTNLKDNYLAWRLDDLLHKNNNPLLLGDNFKEGIYYTHLIRLACQFEPLETIMECYNRITPHSYVPSFRAMEDVFVAIELNDGYDHLPRLWTDLNTFEYMRNLNLVDKLFHLMASKKQDSLLQTRYVEAAQEIFVRAKDELEDMEYQDATRRRPTLSILNAPVLGSLCQICLNSEKNDLAWDILELYLANRQKIVDVPREEFLVKFIEIFIAAKDTEKTLKCLHLMADFVHVSLDKMADKVLTDLKDDLTADQRDQIQTML